MTSEVSGRRWKLSCLSHLSDVVEIRTTDFVRANHLGGGGGGGGGLRVIKIEGRNESERGERGGKK